MIILVTGLFYLIPGVLDMLLYHSESINNLRLSIALLDLKYKRNFLYITTFSSILFTMKKVFLLQYFFYCLFLFSFHSYLNSIKRNCHKLKAI
jgi:hypothetical protein